ncbi:MAG TPA: formate dehydrogenase subunit alpha [bacterium]|nr:formate dehydrogenase subunit alpha [bacterium]HEX68018.1 formate dehydrogenase subunit alpha [bacterium]
MRGRDFRVYPHPTHPVNEGKLCVKGWTGYDFVNSPERLTSPLLKRSNKWIEISWEDAFSIIAEKIRKIKRRWGADAFGFFSSAKCTNEENYLLMKFSRAVVGTNNIDHCARLCHSSTVAGLANAFGSGAMTNSIPEIENADCIFVIGSNTTENHPLVAFRILKAVEKGAKLIVADPRKIELVDFATLYLPHFPGTDVALINGIMKVIVEEGWLKGEFIKKKTENYEEFRNSIEKVELEKIAVITGVEPEMIREAARLYAKSRNSMIIYSMGITQHIHGTDNVLALANLALLTGNVGRPSTGVNPLRGHSNVQGACDMGALPNVFSGYQKVEDPAMREKFEKFWKKKLPQGKGLPLTCMIEAVKNKKIKFLYIMGENPALSDPNLKKTREVLENIEFMVVQDIFLTETAQFADLVLPAATFLEKEGTITGTDRRVQRIRKALEPVGEAKPDWWIITQLARWMGEEWEYTSPQQIMEEISYLTPIYAGINYPRLKTGGLQWPVLHSKHPGTPYLHKEKFSRGKGKFSVIEYLPPAELPDDNFPFILTTGRILFHFHTRTLTSKSYLLEREAPECFVEINKDDAKRLKLREGEKVKVSTRRGAIIVRAKITERIKEGVIFIPFHYSDAPANLLTGDALDPVAYIPEFKVSAARIEKWDTN